MTILNVWVSPERALIGVDSESSRAGERSRCSKLIPFVHLNSVLAIRGPRQFLPSLFGVLHSTEWDMDSAPTTVGPMLDPVFKNMQQVLRTIPGFGPGDERELQLGSTVVLVGYASKRDCLVGWEFEQANAESGFTFKEIAGLDPTHSAPWSADLPQQPDLSSREGMAEYAKLQQMLMRREVPLAGAGGSFIVAELAKHSMQISAVCDLAE